MRMPSGMYTSGVNNTRSFSYSRFVFAQEDVDGARAARLAAFVEQIRASEKIYNQLKSVQFKIASKVKNMNEEPSMMQQLQLLSDPEVRTEMQKLAEIMKEENVNIGREDVGWLMETLKAQMGEKK